MEERHFEREENVYVRTAADVTLKNVISIIEEIRGAGFFKSELESLGKKIETVEAFKQNAKNRRVTFRRETTQNWIKELKDVAYKADNVLDELAFEVLRRPRRSKVCHFFSSSPSFHCKMSREIMNITMSFDKICKKAKYIGLRPDESEIELGIVGRDDDESKVVHMLVHCNYDEDLPVIAIEGERGVGKTALAKLVYYNKEVVSNFSHRMWVDVSPYYDSDSDSNSDSDFEIMLNEMAQYVPTTSNVVATPYIEEVEKSLREHLDGKKYLLVLNDVRHLSDQQWGKMRNCLLRLSGARGSKILVPGTRNEVVSTMHPCHTHRLKKLSNEDSWTMFKNIACANKEPTTETLGLEAVAKDILEECRGVPRKINTLACLMKSKNSEKEFRDILCIQKSISIHEDQTMDFLRRSFDQLPSPSLKQCIAYCSIFLKGFTREKDKIIQLWMAQGYLQPPRGSTLTMEDVGNDYINILERKGFLDLDDLLAGERRLEVISGMEDLALHVSVTRCLTLEVSDLNDCSEVEHLSLLSDVQNISEIPKRHAKNLRTLFSITHLPENIIRDFKCLCVLNLGDSFLSELPSSISKLIHLRYLDLSWTCIERLPNSLTKLHNLQTLRLLDNWFLEELPKEFWKLVGLRHFYIDDRRQNRLMMPMMIGQLTSLQALPFFVVGKEKGHRIEELGCLSNLRGELKIYNLQLVEGKEEAQKAKLSRNSKIEKLRFHWDCDSSSSKKYNTNNDYDVLEGLEPHENLKGLMIENFRGGKFATWMTSDRLQLQKLVKIKLMNCERCEQVPTLGHLPSLEFVEIVGLHKVKRIGTEFYVHGVHQDGEDGNSSSNAARTGIFPVLRELILSDMQELEEWLEASSFAGSLVLFPQLRKLKISSCPLLIRAPLGYFTSIEELSIENINIVAMEKMNDGKPKSLRTLEITSVLGPQLDDVLKELLESNSESLWHLILSDCKELRFLPNNLQNLSSLRQLVVQKCTKLTSLISDIKETEACKFRGLKSLGSLVISDCDELTCLPKEMLQNLQSVWMLVITECPNLITIPDEICSLKSLGHLDITQCKRLTLLPEGLLCLPELITLKIGGFSNDLEDFPWPSSTTDASSTLKELELIGWPKLKSLPNQLQRLTALTKLKIENFDALEALPQWFPNLTSLQSLDIYNCKHGHKIGSSRTPIVNIKWGNSADEFKKVYEMPRSVSTEEPMTSAGRRRMTRRMTRMMKEAMYLS